MIHDRFDLLLDFELLRRKELREPRIAKAGKHRGVERPHEQDEGELTAAVRLLERVKKTFGWVEVVVADALYANGTFLTAVERLGMGAVVIARKENEEPLRGALRRWAVQGPTESFEIKDRHDKVREQVLMWDARDIETLDTYQGPVRVVKAEILKEGHSKPTTWCALVVGRASRLSLRSVLAVMRGRWHIENTAFHQWTTRWRFDHVFAHQGNAISAIYWLFGAAFNLLTFFLYRQLRCYGRDRGNKVNQTISRLIDEMQDDLARLGTFDTG